MRPGKSGVKGLVFDEDGIQIDIAVSVAEVTLEAEADYPEPLEITAFDADGNVIDQVSVAADQTVHTVVSSGEGIVGLVVIGGGGEGILVSICTVAP